MENPLIVFYNKHRKERKKIYGSYIHDPHSGLALMLEFMLATKENFDCDHNRINLAFNKLMKQIGNPVEFELPEWFNKWKPASYTSIKRNIHLTKKIKRRLDDDGIFCSCSSSPGSPCVCGRHCGMLLSSCSTGCKCGNSCLNKPFQH